MNHEAIKAGIGILAEMKKDPHWVKHFFERGLAEMAEERAAQKLATESARLRHRHLVRRLQRSKLVN